MTRCPREPALPLWCSSCQWIYHQSEAHTEAARWAFLYTWIEPTGPCVFRKHLQLFRKHLHPWTCQWTKPSPSHWLKRSARYKWAPDSSDFYVRLLFTAPWRDFWVSFGLFFSQTQHHSKVGVKSWVTSYYHFSLLNFSAWVHSHHPPTFSTLQSTRVFLAQW